MGIGELFLQLAFFKNLNKYKMKKAYIIGSLAHTESNTLIDAVKQYEKAELELNSKGIETINITAYPIPSNEKAALLFRLKKLLSCNECFLLADWQNDKTAELEIITASILGMKIVVANNALPPRKITSIINL